MGHPPPGSQGAGHVIKGSQGTWEILSSPPEMSSGTGLPLDRGPGRAKRNVRRGTKRTTSDGWYRQARQRSAAGGTVGSRSTS